MMIMIVMMIDSILHYFHGFFVWLVGWVFFGAIE